MHNIEKHYIFTKEAYELYKNLPYKYLDSFWTFFENNRFIDREGIIQQFMIKNYYKSINKDNTILEYYDIDFENIDLSIDILLKNPTYVVYQCKYYNIEYDLELADYLITLFEQAYSQEKIQELYNIYFSIIDYTIISIRLFDLEVHVLHKTTLLCDSKLD